MICLDEAQCATAEEETEIVRKFKEKGRGVKDKRGNSSNEKL